MLHKLRQSFSARLSFFILLFTTAIFVAVFFIFYHFSNRTIERNARAESENILRIINLQIEKVLRQVETVPNNLNWIIANGKLTSDSMYSITQSVVRNNPDIYGSAIAFEPYYFKEKGYYFSPYSYRDGDTIRSLQLGNSDYDYFTWEWYSEPKKQEAPCWSEPYYDEGGGQMIMCTYSAPIFDQNKKITGIFTSDISLEWLTDMIDKMKRGDQSDIFMLGKAGTFIVHNQRERILNQTVFDWADEINAPQFKPTGENMIAGNQGMQVIKYNKEKLFVFYAPVPHTSWSLGIIMPKKEVFSDLHQINVIMFLMVGLGLIALFAICLRTVNNQTSPLKRFAATAREIAHGDFDVKLPDIRSKDEMKELFDSFTYMQSKLNSYIANLKETTSAKEKIESELRIARGIQMSMLPKLFPPLPNHNEIDLYATLNPAKEVGGDLYDFFMKDNHLYFAIGDVSGKGVPASLLMAVTLTLFRSVADRMESPATVMNLLNATITENNTSNMFVTLLIGTLDLNTGLLKYCNAGHNPPVIVAADGECKWLEVIPNISAGAMKGFSYIEQSLILPNTSALVLYTDGITEAENAEKKLYGKERLMSMIRANHKLAPREMIEHLLSDIRNYVNGNEPSDDIALLMLRYHIGVAHNTNTLIICNKIEELNKIAQFIEQIGKQMNLPPELIMNLNLAVEEAVANIVQYGGGKQEAEGRKQKAEDGEIELLFSYKDSRLVFTIIDEGVEFDLTQVENPDTTLSAEERPVGGLGIFLIKQIMDEIEYRRENGKNILTLSKKILT